MAKRPRSTKGKIRKNAINLQSRGKAFDDTLKKKWVQKAIDMLKDNFSPAYIKEYIREHKEGSKTDNAIHTIMSEANALITSAHFTKAEEIKTIHRKRYNDLINKCFAVKEIDEDTVDGEIITWKMFFDARNKKIKAMDDCLNTIRQKEELLQYHNKDFVVEVNTEEVIEIKQKGPVYDIDQLPLDRLRMFHQLYQKARLTDNEMAAIVPNTSIDAVVTEDVEAEVVEAPNVQFIKQEQLPEPIKISPVNAFDPTVKLRESLQKLAASKFKEAGGTLTHDEENLIDSNDND